MTAVSPLTRFNIVRKCSGVRQSPPACRQVAVIGIAETADLSSDVSEPYADQGELLASVSPMLFSIKLFGLFFCREDQH